MGNPNIPALSVEERLSCEGEITTEECVKALDTFDNGKTPGNDGIPVEFYKNNVLEFSWCVYDRSFKSFFNQGKCQIPNSRQSSP